MHAANLKIVEPEPADPLAALRAERDALLKRMAEINAEFPGMAPPDTGARDAVWVAVDQLGQAEIAEIAQLDAREQSAMRTWLADGAKGAPPAPDMDLRAGLNRRLADALKLAATMRAATADLVAEQQKVNARVVAITEQIYHSAITEIARMVETEYSAVVRGADEIRQKLAHVFGAVEFLRSVADQHEARGQASRMNSVRQTMQRLDGLQRPNFQPTRQDAFAAIPDWSRALDELLK